MNKLLRGAAILLAVLNATLITVRAQGTAFTYQGQLYNSGSLANGSYDLKLTMFDAATNGDTIAGPVTNTAVAVSNGLFTTTIDFGGVFDGNLCWLRLQVRTNGGGGFTTLSPRQQLTPTPYAEFATTASNVNGTIAFGQLPAGLVTNDESALTLAGNFFGNGAGLTNLNAMTLNGLAAGNLWQLGGNTVGGGQFIGSTNNQPVEIWANKQRAFRVEPDTTGSGAPNVIGGSPNNFMTAGGVIGGFIGGGGAVDYNGAAYSNNVAAYFGTIGGGLGNVVQAYANGGFIGGGYGNDVQNSSTEAVIGGGGNNVAGGTFSFVGGGLTNGAQGNYSTIGGGQYNSALGKADVIAGGQTNNATGLATTVAGGQNNSATANSATVAGGNANSASGQYSAVAGGTKNTASGLNSAVGGGALNTAGGSSATVGGGVINAANGVYSTVGGGSLNFAAFDYGTVAGGESNTAGGTNAAVGGGFENIATNFSVIAGGYGNQALGNDSIVAGGIDNQAQGAASFVGGGSENQALGYVSTATGGIENQAQGIASFVGGGSENNAYGFESTIGGGAENAAGGMTATVPGGYYNNAIGDYSFAAGESTIANYNNSFVWSDGTGISGFIPFQDTGPDQFLIQATGGVGINTNVLWGDSLSIAGSLRMNDSVIYLRAGGDPNHGLAYFGNGTSFGGVAPDGPVLFGYSGGALGTARGANQQVQLQWAIGSVTVNGTFNNNSDRNAKQNFSPVSAAQILEKVSSLPVSEWSYKTDAATRHIGPMAQDFYSAFNVGTDERHIAPIDEGGVALAAIQGLNQKLEEKEQAIEGQAAEIKELKARLERIEKALTATH